MQHKFEALIQCGIITEKGPMWETYGDIRGLCWGILDFGDFLPWNQTVPILVDDLQGPIVDKTQCLVIRAAAGIVCGDGVVNPHSSDSIIELALIFRDEIYTRAIYALTRRGYWRMSRR